MIPVIIGVSFLVFFIMDLAPGDAVDIFSGGSDSGGSGSDPS